jgi:two-component system, OmpR family, sensor histidine kinase MprB
MSLRARMALAGGVAVALAVVAVAVSAYAGTRSELRGQVDNSLRSLTQQVLGPRGGGAGFDGASGGRGGAGGQGLGFAPFAGEGPCVRDEGTGIDGRAGPAFGGAAGIITLVYPAKCGGGTYVPRGQRYRIPVNSQMMSVANSGRGQYLTDMTVSKTHIRVLVTGMGAYGAVAVALPLTDVDHALSSQLLLLVIIAACGIALAALLGLLVARTALAPIARFTRQTERIAANPDRLDEQRLDASGGDELARLARTFNATLDALERSVQAQRNLVADASHELRTPIATIRANLQLMRDEALLSSEDREALRADVIEELDELTALVGDVVELARGSKQSGALGDVRVDEVVGEAVERNRRRAPQLTVRATLEPTLVHGEGDRIARAVANLLDNAAKWSPPGGVIEVDLRDSTLTVRDHGPGFHKEDLPFVFDRFHRAKDARSKPGSGLGLAIVRQAAEAHGGFVEASNALDGGALIRISFGPGTPIPDEDGTTRDSSLQASR